MSIVVATVAIAPVLVCIVPSERHQRERKLNVCPRVAIAFVSFREANLLVVIYSPFARNRRYRATAREVGASAQRRNKRGGRTVMGERNVRALVA